MDNARPSQYGESEEEVIFFSDQETGLRGVTVFDRSAPGPHVGACRSRPYVDEDMAIADALRQARTTTAKAAIAGLPVAGGCMVLLDEMSSRSPSDSSMPAIGRAVETLNGRYFLLPDLQGGLRNMEAAAAATDYVLGRTDGASIETVEATALGLRFGIEAAVQQVLHRDSLMGVRIGIIGLGSVGLRLAEVLRQKGARLTVADRDPRRTERAVGALGISCVATEEIVHLDLDVLAPTAAKDTIIQDMLPHLRCRILAGAVDDPLQSPGLAQALHDQGIIYAPDTVINAGGLISLVQPLLNSAERSQPILEQLSRIGSRMSTVIEKARQACLPTAIVATAMARARFAENDASRSMQLMAS